MGEVITHIEIAKADTAGPYYLSALKLTKQLGMQSLKANCHFGFQFSNGQIVKNHQQRTFGHRYRVVPGPGETRSSKKSRGPVT